MRTTKGVVLIALTIPHVVVGMLLGWGSLAMGATALVISGGVMIARDRKRKRDIPGVPLDPAIPKAPRTPTLPPPSGPPDGPTASPPEPAPLPAGEWHEGGVILPPPPPKPDGPPKLTLIHSDGRRVDVRDFRRRAAGGSK